MFVIACCVAKGHAGKSPHGRSKVEVLEALAIRREVPDGVVRELPAERQADLLQDLRRRHRLQSELQAQEILAQGRSLDAGAPNAALRGRVDATPHADKAFL